MSRFGLGYDAHRLVSGRPLILGGVRVPFERGLEGHSDADVISHAVADAVLGAAGLGELGEIFPASDPRWKDVSSLRLLEGVAERVRAAGLAIINIDAIVVADTPPLRGYRAAMRQNIAAALGVDVERVSIKPKSNEGLGFEGRGEGMSARAIAAVEESD